MRRFRRKLICLALASAVLPISILHCNKAGLNLQRGFWQGLGWSISELLVGAASGTTAK